MKARWRMIASLLLCGVLVWFLADAGQVRQDVSAALALCARSVIPALFPFLVVSATGTHRTQTKEEHIGLVTQAVYDRIRVEDHVCTDQDNLVHVGDTSRGTPVWLDKRAMACDHIVLTGGVVFHFMAGFGGGRKSVLPGISGRETIMKNHNQALNPGIGNGSNP